MQISQHFFIGATPQYLLYNIRINQLTITICTIYSESYIKRKSANYRFELTDFLRAGNGGRTRDPQLGKLMLYH